MKKLLEFDMALKKNAFQIAALVISLVFPIIIPIKYLIHILTISWIWGLAAMGWNICFGYAGLLSFGHTAFFGIGAYATVFLILFFDITPWLGIFIASALSAAFGIAITWLTARAKGVYFALATSAIPNVLMVLFTWNYQLTGGSLGLTIPYHGESLYHMQFDSILPYYYIALALLLLTIMFMKKFDRSKIGYYLKAIGAEEDAAKSIGVDAFRTRIIGMGISSFITGLAGGIFVNFMHFIDPMEAFGWTMNLQIVLSAIFGGVGTIFGPVIGSLAIVPLSEIVKLFLEEHLRGIHLAIYGIILMLAVLIMPKGIYPKISKVVKIKSEVEGG